MRRMTAMLLMMCLFALTLTAETATPNVTGKWRTAGNETLCAAILLINPDGTFRQTTEGHTVTGVWSLSDSALTLTADRDFLYGVTVETLTAVYTFDEENTVITVPGGLHLYRADSVLPIRDGEAYREPYAE